MGGLGFFWKSGADRSEGGLGFFSSVRNTAINPDFEKPINKLSAGMRGLALKSEEFPKMCLPGFLVYQASELCETHERRPLF